MYPFLIDEDKEIFLKSIDQNIEYYKDNKYLLNFSKYFHKNWEKSNF